jgi:hypothetical protein
VLRLAVLLVCVLKGKIESWHGRETGWPNCTCNTDAPLSGNCVSYTATGQLLVQTYGTLTRQRHPKMNEQGKGVRSHGDSDLHVSCLFLQKKLGLESRSHCYSSTVVYCKWVYQVQTEEAETQLTPDPDRHRLAAYMTSDGYSDY